MCTKSPPPKHLILGVGGNDLMDKDPGSCAKSMEGLIQCVRQQSASTEIHILPAFERLNNSQYNAKVSRFNEKLKQLCSSTECRFIENPVINSRSRALYSDGIHFSELGMKSFARVIKTHLNPILGMKPYSEYTRDNIPRDRPRGGRRGTSTPRQRSVNDVLQELAKLITKEH